MLSGRVQRAEQQFHCAGQQQLRFRLAPTVGDLATQAIAVGRFIQFGGQLEF
jgi:hypothetical protein